MYLGSVKFYKHLIYVIIVIVLVLALVGLGFLISLIMPKENIKSAGNFNNDVMLADNSNKTDQNQNPADNDKGVDDKKDADKIDDEKQDGSTDVSDSSEQKSKDESNQIQKELEKASQELGEKLGQIKNEADKKSSDNKSDDTNSNDKNSEESSLVDNFPNLYCEKFEIIPTDKKTAYLTFDDGPSENTEKILEILKEHNIKATFFVITGEYNSKNLDLLKKIYEEGHTIGIHSHSHVYKEIYDSKESFLEDMNSASDIIYEKINVRPSILRFPGGSINEYNKNIYQDTIDELAKRNFQYYDWNVSFDDAKKNTSVDEIVQSAMYGIEQNKDKNIIMLAHDQAKNNVALEALEKVIDVLESYGYSFDKIDNSVEPITFLNKLEVDRNNK